MAVHPEHTLTPKIGRRAFLGGTAGALATVTIPTAAVAAGNPAAEPDWQALHDELQALYDADDASHKAFVEARDRAEAAHTAPPTVPSISTADDGETWKWTHEPTVEVLGRDEFRFYLTARIDAYFKREISAARGIALRERWPSGTFERFQEEGEKLRLETQRQAEAWQAACAECDRIQGVDEADDAMNAIGEQLDDLENRISAAPTASLAAVWVKLAIIHRRIDKGSFAEKLVGKMREEIEEAGPPHRA